ncbi:MAG: site-specific DNA-methyltransferase [Microbacterium sp.]|nr:site-specific DNA-methyltransferase [Microbacterium sp.]
MVDHVRDAVSEAASTGRLLDLFAGMATVAESVSSSRPVVLNDAMHVAGVFARARFLDRTRTRDIDAVLGRLRPSYEAQADALRRAYALELAAEVAATRASKAELHAYMARSNHVANSPDRRRAARAAAQSSGADHYGLTALYFSAGYFSLAQSVELDALRAAIDADPVSDDRDWLLAAWLAAASAAINSPGHTAQFLSARTDSGYRRVLRSWGYDIRHEFVLALQRVRQLGTQNWRQENEVIVGNALALVSGAMPQSLGVVYADPPYTRDHYSRFYHVYETLLRYDFPDAHGQGRTRSDGFLSDFSSRRRVAFAFHELFRGVRRWGVPLVVSYPSSGLLERVGDSVEGIARQHRFGVEVREHGAQHSTMGGSRGASRVGAIERIYICRPE